MSGVFYNTVAVIIFAFVAINFLFPCNYFVPLDRRTTSVLGALLCYLTRRFLFPNANMDVVQAVDFDVMILLASIMIINHIVVHLKETKDVIDYLQNLVNEDPVRGLWVISLAAFMASPFLTNDGVCLLFVEPILNAFEQAPFASEIIESGQEQNGRLVLRKEDALYFLLALACSANIGSALTYTGNPQNMIVASDSLRVLPSYKFFIYMLPASLFAWFTTMEYIRRCWMHARSQPVPLQVHVRSPSMRSLHSRKASSSSRPRQGRGHDHHSSHLRQLSSSSHHSSISKNNDYSVVLSHKRNSSGSSIASTGASVHSRASSGAHSRVSASGGASGSAKGGANGGGSGKILAIELSPCLEGNEDNLPFTPPAPQRSGNISTKAGASATTNSTTSANNKSDDTAGNCSNRLSSSFWDLSIWGGDGIGVKSSHQSSLSPLSPRRRQALERAKMTKRITRFVSSPFPYIVLVLLGLMIVMIFIDVMPISGLICVFAIVMVVTVVLGNHWRNTQVWIEEEEEETYYPMAGPAQPSGASGPGHTTTGAAAGAAAAAAADTEDASDPSELERGQMPGSTSSALVRVSKEEDLGPLTREDRLDNLNQFFEALFGSIDYSLLIIFLGLFIVVENMASTGIPERVWSKIVGKAPFSNATSIIGISLFVLISSQFLGNVAVIQLAKPNVESLDDNTKRLAWAIISFVATVGGNLTITGSAANIIVAEKAARLDSTMAIDFFRHYRVCFWVTLLGCAVGGAIITMIGMADNATGSDW